MGSIIWGPEIAGVYDKTYAARAEPSVLGPAVDLLAGLARGGRCQDAWVFTLDPDHAGIETFDDTAGQIAWSHPWIEAGGRLVRHCALPVRVAIRARPHGQDHGVPGPGPLDGLEPGTVHLRQPQPGRGL